LAREKVIDLPEKPVALTEQMTRLNRLLSEKEELEKDVVNALGEAFAAVNPLSYQTIPVEVSQQKQKTAHDAVSRYRDTVIKFNYQVKKFSDNVLDEISLLTKREERKLSWANYASYALFLVGWALGPLGKALKLPAIESAKE